MREAGDGEAEEDPWTVVTKTQLYEYDWPRGGMFIWIRMLFASHPLLGRPLPPPSDGGDPDDPERLYMNVEVSGLPKDGPFREQMKTARDQFKNHFGDKLPAEFAK